MSIHAQTPHPRFEKPAAKKLLVVKMPSLEWKCSLSCNFYTSFQLIISNMLNVPTVRFKRLALEVVAFSLEPRQIKSLRHEFEKFDVDHR